VPSILTVCTGNICRSPLAALLLAQKLASFAPTVTSAGTHALADMEVTAETARLAHAAGVADEATAAHRARRLTDEHLNNADLILAMTRGHRREIADIAPHRQRATFTLREFARIADEMTDDELRIGHRSEDPASVDPSARVRAMAAAVAHRRGFAPRPANPDDDDVDDPYGGTWDDYVHSAAQLEPAVDSVVRAVTVALG